MTETFTAPETAPIDPAVEAALVAIARGAHRVAARARAHPERVRPPRARRRHGRDRRVDRRTPARPGRDRGRGHRDRPASDRLRPDPRGAGRADRHRLLPLRRPAGRPARPVGAPAVRAVRPRRPVHRPRRLGRQGPARDAPGAARGAARGRPGAGGQPDLRVRGRGGVRLGEPGGVDPRAPRPARGRRGRHQRHGLLRGQPAGDHRRPARASCTRRSTSSCRRSTSTPGMYGGDGPQPGQRAGHDRRRAQGPRRARPHPGLLRRRGRR